MAESHAQSWLALHHGIIPALDVYKQRAVEILQNPRKNLADLAAVIVLDPGMSLSLYQQANGRLLDRGKPAAESIDDALAALGNGAIIDLVTQHKTVFETQPEPAAQQAYHQLMSRIYYLLALVDEFIAIQGIRRVNETRSAAALHNIGEIHACLFDFRQYRKYQANFHVLGADVNSARPVFGFGFRELGRLICWRTLLPPLVAQSLGNTLESDRRVRVIQYAADISHQAEEGWDHPSMKATQAVCAHYLNQSIDGFEVLVQQTAIASARSCSIEDSLPAASRLVMLPEAKSSPVSSAHRPASVTIGMPAGQIPQADRNYQARLKNLIKKRNIPREQLLDLLLDHLHEDLHLTRVLLLTLSDDRVKLGTRASRGIRRFSLLNELMINTDENRMFRSLLSKPLGLWVESANYAQYEDFLPASFRNSVLSENFFLMTIFSGAIPEGIIFGDRAHSVSALDRELFIRFKAAVLLTGNGLDRLSHQRAG
jgi:HD-like signal output (HDOD) protein